MFERVAWLATLPVRRACCLPITHRSTRKAAGGKPFLTFDTFFFQQDQVAACKEVDDPEAGGRGEAVDVTGTADAEAASFLLSFSQAVSTPSGEAVDAHTMSMAVEDDGAPSESAATGQAEPVKPEAQDDTIAEPVEAVVAPPEAEAPKVFAKVLW